tara:strand:- start:256 stop:393 length:138 start_codon:yes stop_codon:yes gene_type:complete
MELPEENIGSATGNAREDSFNEGGNPGILEELDKAISKHPKIKFT